MMNNTTNYAYLSGYLMSVAKDLAVNDKFLRLKSENARLAFVNKQIAEAQTAAIAHAKKYGI
jgi:hypothetical protein